jgi:predicted transcriptional regulator|tara:strand:- start:506 stop:754 length:249 start_codon:yes stop_codon:yes gene_type:complete
MGLRLLGRSGDGTQTFGNKMRRYRYREALNQSNFGYIVGIPQWKVSEYERGVVPVPLDVQEKVECAVEILQKTVALEVEVDG